MPQFFVESNGVRHAIRTYGRGPSTIVFLHYLGGTKEVWNSLIPFFEQDFQILTIDLRGHGLSDVPESGYTLEDYSRDLKGIMDFLGVDKAHFVGSSFGCDVAVRFVYDHPDRALSLSMSEGAMYNPSGQFGIYSESKEELLNKYFGQPEETFESWETFYQYMEREWLPWNDAKARYVKNAYLRRVQGGKWALPVPQNVVAKVIGHLYEESIENYYSKVTCPVLFLPAEKEHGLDIKLAFIEHVKPFIDCRTHIIPGSVHTMMFDHSKPLARAILEKAIERPAKHSV